MLKLIKADNGMNILGRGPLVMLFALPALGAAVMLHIYMPRAARLPLPSGVIAPLGALIIAAGAIMWLVAVAQLLTQFPRGKLVTTGAYAICRNPIYASFGILILPGISFVTGTWVYIVAGAVLCLGVLIFIRKEEQDLLRVFGDDYRSYVARVHRIVPFAGLAGSR